MEKNIQTLNQYSNVFNNRLIITIAKGKNIENAEIVKKLFKDKRIEFIEVENDPILCEVEPLMKMLKKIQSVDPEEITFYGHAKGVGYPLQIRSKKYLWRYKPLSSNLFKLKNIAIWRDLMYFFCLNKIDRIENILKKNACCGCFKKNNPSPPQIKEYWHFSGNFFWFNHYNLFSQPNWANIKKYSKYAAEGYIGGSFKKEEAYCLFGEKAHGNFYHYNKDQWVNALRKSINKNNLSKKEIRMANSIINEHTKVNILYLNINSHLGGAEKCLLEEATSLDKNKFNPIVGLFCKGPLIDELKKGNINYKIFTTSKRLLRQSQENVNLQLILNSPLVAIETLKIIKNITQFIKKNNISVVISNSFKTHLISFLLKKSINTKIIWRYHDLLPNNKYLKNLLLVFAKKVPNRIITNSNFVKNQFIKNNIDKKKVTTIYPIYINEELLCSSKERNNYRESFNLTEKDFAIGCLGILVPWKGQEYLIRAAKLLKNRIPNLKVFIVGDEIYDTKAATSKKYLMNLTKELGLEDIIIFTGFLKEPQKILNALDIVVHTSIKPEPFGRVIVEAMFCEKSIIATAAGGPLEIIKNNQTGILIPPKRLEELAKNILDLYNNHKKRKLIGKNGKKFAIKYFNVKKQIKSLEKIYIQ